MTMEEVVAMVNEATVEEVRDAKDDTDLYLIYDFYVISYYTGGDGPSMTPESFVEYWGILTEEEKRRFIHQAFI